MQAFIAPTLKLQLFDARDFQFVCQPFEGEFVLAARVEEVVCLDRVAQVESKDEVIAGHGEPRLICLFADIQIRKAVLFSQAIDGVFSLVYKRFTRHCCWRLAAR